MREWFISLFTPFIKFLGSIGLKNSPIDYSRGMNFLEGIAPGDIFLVWKPWQAINLIIPGQYKHAAIYVGGGSVVESTGEEGVHLSDIHDFISHYYKIACLRPKFSTISENKIAVDEAIKLVGSKYDFTLDDDGTSFYCSEVIVYAYLKAHPRVKLYNRTILGDSVIYPQDLYDDKENWKVIKEIK